MKLLPSGDLDEDANGGLLHNVQSRQVLMQKLSRDGVNFNPGGGMSYPSLPSMTTPNPGGNFSNSQSTPYGNNNHLMYSNNGQLVNQLMSQGQITQSNCVLLSNLFDENIDLEQDPNFFTEIYEDVYEECSQFGKVGTMWVDQKSPGNIWVKYDNNNIHASTLTLEKLNGR
jgi:RNA-binding protein 39